MQDQDIGIGRLGAQDRARRVPRAPGVHPREVAEQPLLGAPPALGQMAHKSREMLQQAIRAVIRRDGEAVARLEALVLHGVDDDVIPVENGRAIRDLLGPLLGDRATYAEHDAGHFVTRESVADAAAWIAVRIG